MTVGTYAPRVHVASNRYGNVKTHGPNLWAVLHTTEGSETSQSAEILGGILGVPGTRPNGRGGFYGASYHTIFDTDQLIPAVPYDTVAYSAGGGNARGIHGVFPGRASQTRAQWLDDNTRPMIRQAAAWLVDLNTHHKIPIDGLTVAEVARRNPGVCDHHDISLAFGKSTHTDLGEHFPWDVLFADIDNLTTPQPPPPRPSGGHTMNILGSPIRLFDSRDWQARTIPAGEHEFETPAVVPVTESLTLTVTVTEPTANGHVTVWDGEGSKPVASCLNYQRGQTIANTTAVAVSHRKFKVYLQRPAHLILDVVGYV